MSHVSASARGDSANDAPSSTSGAALSGVRFHTVTDSPHSSRRCTIGVPMSPVPMNPIRGEPAMTVASGIKV